MPGTKYVKVSFKLFDQGKSLPIFALWHNGNIGRGGLKLTLNTFSFSLLKEIFFCFSKDNFGVLQR